jgi:CheY-like chemotaxis protein
MTAHALAPDTEALLDREIDDLLLDARGLALVRDLLEERGASTAEIASHARALNRVRTRLVDLISARR